MKLTAFSNGFCLPSPRRSNAVGWAAGPAVIRRLGRSDGWVVGGSNRIQQTLSAEFMTTKTHPICDDLGDLPGGDEPTNLVPRPLPLGRNHERSRRRTNASAPGVSSTWGMSCGPPGPRTLFR